VWIEMNSPSTLIRPQTSLPARGVWIEMMSVSSMENRYAVAPRKGSVD